MSFSISSSNLAISLLLLSDCNPETSIGKAINNMCLYFEEKSPSSFPDKTELEMSIFWLLYNSEKCSITDSERLEALLDSTSLGSCISCMLTYKELYINDEGEHWFVSSEKSNATEEGNYDTLGEYEIIIDDFLKTEEALKQDRIKIFLDEAGLEASYLDSIFKP